MSRLPWPIGVLPPPRWPPARHPRSPVPPPPRVAGSRRPSRRPRTAAPPVGSLRLGLSGWPGLAVRLEGARHGLRLLADAPDLRHASEHPLKERPVRLDSGPDQPGRRLAAGRVDSHLHQRVQCLQRPIIDAAGDHVVAPRRPAASAGEHLGHLSAHLFALDAEGAQHAEGDGLLHLAVITAEQRQEQVLRADVAVAEGRALLGRQLDYPPCPGGEGKVAPRRGVASAHDELHGGADPVRSRAQVAEHLGGDALSMRETKQQVLRADVTVIQRTGLVFGPHQGLLRSIREPLEPFDHESCRLLPRNGIVYRRGATYR